MNALELAEIIKNGEDGKNQLKEIFTNEDQLAAEMIAFTNAQGGKIIIGVSDDGGIKGLSNEEIRKINQLVSNVASNNIKPAISPMSENIMIDGKVVIVLIIAKGTGGIYLDNKGAIWTKNGSDKRRVTSSDEIQRMLQKVGMMHADEQPVRNIGINNIDIKYFEDFFKKEKGITIEESGVDIKTLLSNMNLMSGEELNLTGALIFSKNLEHKLPVFIVKAISYPGEKIDQENYIESKDIVGNLRNIFDETIAFIMRHLRYLQNGQNINSHGEPEIEKVVFEEIIANALIHRNYFISATIRVFIYANRIEIISPGHLPNNLTVENILNFNSNVRNPVLASFANRIIPYRGFGSGISRALKAYPHIEFEDDRDGNTFRVRILRKGI